MGNPDPYVDPFLPTDHVGVHPEVSKENKAEDIVQQPQEPHNLLQLLAYQDEDLDDFDINQTEVGKLLQEHGASGNLEEDNNGMEEEDVIIIN